MTTLFKQLPIAEKLWADHKDPNNYTIESKAIIKWRCEKGHIYKKPIDAFVRNQECQICRALNNRITNNPKAVEMWDYEKNKVDISKATQGSSKSYWWRCSNGHSFRRECARFTESNGECPYCKMDTIDKHPELMNQFDLENNPDIDIHHTSCNSKKIANWKCKKCGYTWKAQIASRHLGANHCPCCEEKIVVMPGFNDIFTLYPELKLDFNDTLDPSTEGVSSSRQTKWKCHVCGYEWKTSLGSRVAGGKIRRCPSCTGQIRTKSYAEQYPELKKCYSKSNQIPFEEVITGQQQKNIFLWNCDKHGEFEQYLSVMIRGLKTEFKGCPYCAGKKVKLEDSFGYNHPELIDEYSPKNKEGIFNVSLGSRKKGLWHCPKCGNEWKTTFDTRNHGFGYCKNCFPHSKYKRMLIDERPDLEKYYRGDRPFNSYSFLSNKEVEWECEEGHRFKRIIYNASQNDGFKCPICDGVRLEAGINDLASNYPELLEEWSPNNERKPDEVVKSSNLHAKWVCKECGYEYQAKIQEKINGYICPVCDDRTTVEGYNDLRTTHPELAREYSKNNERDITTVRKNIDVSLLWNCPKCDGEYSYSVKEREVGDDSCPYCTNNKVLTGFNDLATKYPELVESYLDENELPANKVLYTSKKDFKWGCPTCSGKYKTTIFGRQGDNCPYCNDWKFLPGHNDLKTKLPELAKLFSKNNPFTAEEVFYKSHDYFNWNCPTCGGEYSTSITGIQENHCPYCENRKVLPGFNDLETLYPEIAKSFSKQNDYPASQVLCKGNYDHLWDCPTCGGTYKANFDERIDGKCPYCENKKVLTGFNDLKTVYPELAESYSEDNILTADKVLYTSIYYHNWDCKECNGKYKSTIYKRANDGCPYCDNKKVLAGFNDISVTHPQLAKMWSSNNERQVTEFIETNTFNALWKCNICGGEYDRSINNMVADDSCPYCENKKVLIGFNDLKTTHPKVVEEWGIENYLLGIGGPENYKSDSTKRAYWKCSKCGTRYKMPIDDYIIKGKRGHESCWKCAGRMKNILKL